MRNNVFAVILFILITSTTLLHAQPKELPYHAKDEGPHTYFEDRGESPIGSGPGDRCKSDGDLYYYCTLLSGKVDYVDYYYAFPNAWYLIIQEITGNKITLKLPFPPLASSELQPLLDRCQQMAGQAKGADLNFNLQVRLFPNLAKKYSPATPAEKTRWAFLIQANDEKNKEMNLVIYDREMMLKEMGLYEIHCSIR